MTLDDMITTARDRLGDTAPQPLWSDDELTSYANDAQREACRRARLIIDSTTADICQIALTATDVTYDLDPRILFIRRAKLVGRSPVLRPVSYKDLDCQAPDWEAETGEPSHFVPDQSSGKFRPYPSPTVAGVVNLTVIRLPLEDLAGDADEPEIKPHLHESLVNWMLYRACLKNDAETLNKVKAAEYLALFEAEFGKKSTAVDETWIEREHGFDEFEGIY